MINLLLTDAIKLARLTGVCRALLALLIIAVSGHGLVLNYLRIGEQQRLTRLAHVRLASHQILYKRG